MKTILSILVVGLLLVARPAAAQPPAPHLTATFKALTAGMVTTQVLDITSTRAGIKAGAEEGNGLMKWAVGHPARMAAVKAGIATTIFLMARSDAKHGHGVRACVTLSLVIALQTVVDVHNYRLAAQLRAGRR